MTKFKWKGPNNFICRDLMLAGVLEAGEVLINGQEFEIPDTEENELLITRLKRPQEPYFELIINKSSKKKTKENDE